MKRRTFIKQTAITTGILSFVPLSRLISEEIKKKYANDIVTLGNTDIKVSRLAMGTGTHGFNRRSNQTEKLGIEGVADLLKSAFDEGINFWDSADVYGTHPHLREALKLVPREKVVILTKTRANSVEEMKSDLDRFRTEIGTDYIDIILLHLMRKDNWPELKQGAMEVLVKAREDGIIKAHGVSCHSLDALETTANTDWVQVNMVRINPDGINMDADVPTVVRLIEKMHKDGKGIIGMKIFGGGKLTDKIDECLKFVLKLECVHAFTIGQENQEQMRYLVKRIPEMSEG